MTPQNAKARVVNACINHAPKRPWSGVFEHGAGNSSLWWAKKTAEVVSVEHDEKWAATVRSKAPKNLSVISRPKNSLVYNKTIVSDFLSAYPDQPSLGSIEMDEHAELLIEELPHTLLKLQGFRKGISILSSWMEWQDHCAHGLPVNSQAITAS